MKTKRFGLMMLVCVMRFTSHDAQAFYKPIPPDLAAKQLLCASLAQTYYSAVAAAGDSAYAAGQTNGCKCKCKTN